MCRMSLRMALLEKGLRSELPEVLAEAELEMETCKLLKNQEDIKVISEYHNAVIHDKIMALHLEPNQRSGRLIYLKAYEPELMSNRQKRDIQKPAGSDVVCPDDPIFRPELQKLARKWYAAVHGITVVKVSQSQNTDWPNRGMGHHGVYGTIVTWDIDWSGDEDEGAVKQRLLLESRRYTSEMTLAMQLLKPRLPDSMVERIKDFVPYVAHLQQQIGDVKNRLASPTPW